MDDQTDRLARARAGDAEAFAWLVAGVRDRALALARALGAGAQAEDVVQEACLLAHRHLGRLERPDAFAGWLLAIVRTCAQKQGRRRRPDLLDDLRDPPAAVDPQPDPGERVARGELAALVRDAVRGLPAREAAAVERHYLEGRSVAETAARLGIPAGTVKRQLFEARARLRARLAGLAAEPPPVRRGRPLRRPL